MYTFLYDDGEYLVFMHSETFEQISIKKDMVGERRLYKTHDRYHVQPLRRSDFSGTPDTVVMELLMPFVKGQTASSSYKPAVFENGGACYGASHIETGTNIVVRPERCELCRASKKLDPDLRTFLWQPVPPSLLLNTLGGGNRCQPKRLHDDFGEVENLQVS